MAITYYPNRIQKGSAPAIDKTMARIRPYTIRGAANIASNAMSEVISANGDWKLDSIKFTFNGAASRDYSAKIMGGRKVLTDLNDYLWFQTPNTLWQKITLSAGFYSGTQLATELQTKLNANIAFAALNLTFTVTYSAITGLFTITPSSSTLRYLSVNPAISQRYRDSIAGHLFGLTATSAYDSTVVSDTTVFGLDEESWIIDETASNVTENFFNDVATFDMDQALHLATNTASVTVNYAVTIEELI